MALSTPLLSLLRRDLLALKRYHALQEYIPGFPGKTFGRVTYISHHPFSILRAVSEAYTV